jgi:hypothetical protein
MLACCSFFFFLLFLERSGCRIMFVIEMGCKRNHSCRVESMLS